MTLIFRVLYLAYRVYTGLRYRAVRRFTPAGLTLLVGFIVAMMMGIDTDNNVEHQAFAMLLPVLGIAAVFLLSFRGRFEAERLLPRFGTVGTPLSYTVLVRNLGTRGQTGLALLENLHDPRPSFREWMRTQVQEQRQSRSFRMSQPNRTSPFKMVATKDAAVPFLPRNRQVGITVGLTPIRRGVLRFQGLTLARPDPLGLVRSFSRLPLPQTLLVLPKRYPVPPIALPGSLRHQPGGVAQASNVGQSEDFVALRDYRNGDPLRHIHWRTWARVGRPVVREFEDEFFVRHALVLDTFCEQEPGEVFEEAVSVAASFACSVQTQESLLDLLFVGTEQYCFTAGRGLGRADQLLEVLASVRACLDKPFSFLEALVVNHASLVSGCICVLLAWDQQRQDFVRKLVALGVPVLVLVVVPAGHPGVLDPGPLAGSRTAVLHALRAGDIERGLANLP